MSDIKSWWLRLRSPVLTVAAILVASAAGAYALTDLPQRFGLVAATDSSADDHHHGADEHDDHSGHDHSGHDHSGHDHGGHSDSESIELSAQARANLRLRTATVAVGPFTEFVEVPGLVTRWPGRTHVSVTSPLTGVINAISVSRGELISGGTPLFSLRLTHQDLVKTQEAFLSQLGQLDVEQREIDRLASVSNSGAIAGKTRLAREYERDKLMAGIRAARQSMLLHGLSEDQITKIERTRTLIREVIVTAPEVHEDNSLHHESLSEANNRMADAPSARVAALQPPTIAHPPHVDTQFLVTALDVRRGESVTAGMQIAQLSDYSNLLIEGQAYQRDADLLRAAADNGAPCQAIMMGSNGQVETIKDLQVLYIGNEIGRESRALPFYLGLQNQVARLEQRDEKQYVSWFYKPGQRLTVRLPVSQIENAIVVPKQAVAEQGPERFLFVENGDHFDRIPVTVLASDSVHVAIKNDGQVWPGQTVAVSGAHQLQMAMQNKSGGAIDPHAGHNH